MREWATAAALFFVYVAVGSLLTGGLSFRRRLHVVLGAATGLALSAGALILPHSSILHDWVLPPVLLLLAYWISGLLYTGPMPRAEHLLEAVDRVLRVDTIAASVPGWLAELLEVAYVLVYPAALIALGIHVLTSERPSPDTFWTVILVTDFICFGVLPWVQTRPPRAFRPHDPWRSRLRRLNLQLLDRTSIQVNTFPSGHAAEALAAALLVADAPWPFAAAMAVTALLISVGTVLGRYHYAADVIAGWAVAICVWLAVR
jgi:membrane-associated phospholipid phosphatase